MTRKWKTISSQTVFSTPYIQVQEDCCLLPNNKRYQKYLVKIKNWGIILAFTPQNKIVLVKQYRHAAQTFSLELPAGEFENTETKTEGIRRELLEETGYSLARIQKLAQWYPLIGKSPAQVTAFIGFTRGERGKQKQDAHEQIQVILKTPKQALKMVQSGKIKESSHAAAILLAKEKYPERFR